MIILRVRIGYVSVHQGGGRSKGHDLLFLHIGDGTPGRTGGRAEKPQPTDWVGSGGRGVSRSPSSRPSPLLTDIGELRRIRLPGFY